MTPSVGRPRGFDRAEALDTATRVFWRRGYAATSVRDLTAALGIGAPSLYHAFTDKRTLFAEALEHYAATYGDFISRAVHDEPTARAAAARIFRQAPRQYTRPGLPSGCLIEHGAAGGAEPGVQQALAAQRSATVALLATKIREDTSSGELPVDTDPVTLARYTMTVLGGLAEGAHDGVPRTQLQRVAAFAAARWP